MPPPVVAIIGLVLSGGNFACNAIGVWDIMSRLKKDGMNTLQPNADLHQAVLPPPPPAPAEDKFEAMQRQSRQYLAESWSILHEFGEQFGIQKYQLLLDDYRELRAHYHKAHASPLSKEEMQCVFENVLQQSSFFHNELLRESDLIRTGQAMQRIEEMKAELADKKAREIEDSTLDSDLD